MAAEQGARRPSVRAATPWALGVLVAAALALQTQLTPARRERSRRSSCMSRWRCRGTLSAATPAAASFGQVVFFGIGGYFTAVAMTHLGWFSGSLWSPAALRGLLRSPGRHTAAAAARALLRDRDPGMAEGTREIVTNLPDLTGGGGGITPSHRRRGGDDALPRQRRLLRPLPRPRRDRPPSSPA